MKDSIHKYFQIGTIQWMSHPPADYELLESIKTICCDDYFRCAGSNADERMILFVKKPKKCWNRLT